MNLDEIQRTLALLHGEHVAEASFHPDGSLASVVFAPDTSVDDVPHETPAPVRPRMRSAGGVVPRVVRDGE